MGKVLCTKVSQFVAKVGMDSKTTKTFFPDIR